MSTLHRISRVALLILLAMGLVATAFANGGSDAADEPTEMTALGMELFGDIEPLDEPIDLTLCLGAGWSQTMPFYFIEENGGFDAIGINVSFEEFGNGPVMVEALGADAWDLGSYGLGGIITGTIQHEAVLLGPSIYDAGSLQYFTSKDHPIVKAGTNVAEAPGLYGTADLWRGKEIYVQTGTTLHYALVKGLEYFGLTGDDVQITHMDVPNANAALRSGKGTEIAGIWGSMAFDPTLLEKFQPVIRGDDVDVGLIATVVANPRSYADPAKNAAIKKVVEMYYIANEWIMPNLREACEDYFKPLAFSQGFDSPTEDLMRLLDVDPLFTLEEAYEIVTTMVDTDRGKLPKLTAGLVEATSFFVDQGNYEPEVLDQLVTVFDTSMIEEIYEGR